MKSRTKLAKLAYDIYCKAVGGKAFNGDLLPAFEATPERIQKAWDETSFKVFEAAFVAGLIVGIPITATLILALMGIISLFR